MTEADQPTPAAPPADLAARREIEARAWMLIAQLDSAFHELDALRPHVEGLRNALG